MFGRAPDPIKRLAADVQEGLLRQHKRISALEQHLAAVSRSVGLAHLKDKDSSMASLRDQEQHYVQLILLVGYAGVFTLWVQTRGEMSNWMFASTGALITLSLLSFVGFELYKAFTVGRRLSTITEKDDLEAEYNKSVERVNKYWFASFVVSAVSGVTAGLSLLLWFVYRAIMAAYGWL